MDGTENTFQFIIKTSGGTDLLMKFPEEFAEFTSDQEKAFLRANCDNKNELMIICLVDGRTAGGRQISFRTGEKDRHRVSVAIALLQGFWNLGVGTRMLEEVLQAAGKRGNVRQIGLDFIEGSKRARGLHEKMGFQIIGVKPDVIRTRDGSFVNEHMMVKRP